MDPSPDFISENSLESPRLPPPAPQELVTVQSREMLARNWVKVQPSLLAFIMASTPQFNDAQDLLQEVAAEIALRFDDYDPARPFLPWALWVAKIKIADFYRSRQRNRMTFVGESIDALAEACTRVQATLTDERWALERCLASLTDRSRELLQLRYAEDLKPHQIGPRVGMSAPSVRASLSRIRSALTACVHDALGQEPQNG